MTQWIETKLRYEKIDKRGKLRKVTESYLVDALSFAEAEARITSEMKHYISGDFTVSAVKKANISEVFGENAEDGKWYKVRVAFIIINERSGDNVRKLRDFMIKADDIFEAIAGFQYEITMLADYEIISVCETPILDIFPVYKPKLINI